MPAVGEILEGKEICICAGSGGVGKTTTSAAIAAGMAARGLKVCVLTIDPAKRLADSLGLEELGNEATPGRPGAVRGAGGRDEGRAVGDDARREGDLRRAGRPPGARRGVARPHPRTTASTADLQRPGRLAGVHGDGEAVRAAHRGRASTCSSSTRRRPATRSTSSTRRRRLTQFIEGRSLQVFMKPTGLAAQGRRARRLGGARRASSGSSAST